MCPVVFPELVRDGAAVQDEHNGRTAAGAFYVASGQVIPQQWSQPDGSLDRHRVGTTHVYTLRPKA